MNNSPRIVVTVAADATAADHHVACVDTAGRRLVLDLGSLDPAIRRVRAGQSLAGEREGDVVYRATW